MEEVQSSGGEVVGSSDVILHCAATISTSMAEAPPMKMEIEESDDQIGIVKLERAAVMSGETRTERKRRLARERSRRYRERHAGQIRQSEGERSRQRRLAGTAVDNRDHKERSRQRRLAGTLVDNRDHKELSRQRRLAGTLVDNRDHKERSRQRRAAGTHGDYRDHKELSRQRRAAGTHADYRDHKERSRQRRLAGKAVDNRDHKELSRQRRAAGTVVDRRDQKERSRQRRLAGTHADYRVRSRKQGRKEETPCTSNLVQESGAPGNGSVLPIPAVETPWELRICIVCFGIKVFARPAAVAEPYTCPPCSVFSRIKQGPMQLQPGKDAFPGIIEQTPDSVPPERQPEPNVSTSLSESGGQ